MKIKTSYAWTKTLGLLSVATLFTAIPTQAYLVEVCVWKDDCDPRSEAGPASNDILNGADMTQPNSGNFPIQVFYCDQDGSPSEERVHVKEVLDRECLQLIVGTDHPEKFTDNEQDRRIRVALKIKAPEGYEFVSEERSLSEVDPKTGWTECSEWFRTEVPRFDVGLVPAGGCEEEKIGVDIKPQSCPNPVNVNGGGVLPVAITGAKNFDACSIDPRQVHLVNPKGPIPFRWDCEDVATFYDPFEREGQGAGDSCMACITGGADGFADLTLKFDKDEVIQAVVEEARGGVKDGDCVPVKLFVVDDDGTVLFTGEDMIRIVSKQAGGAVIIESTRGRRGR